MNKCNGLLKSRNSATFVSLFNLQLASLKITIIITVEETFDRKEIIDDENRT